MDGLRIVSTGRALPEKVVTNDDLSKMVDTSDEWISSRTGIRERRISEKGETNYELAAKAALRAIEKAGVDRNEIGALIVATMTPDYMLPSTACLVQKELCLPEDVMAFDISAACSGFLYGVKAAKGLLSELDKKYAVVIGSEQVSRILDFTDRSTCVLFGDGAGAAVIELSDSHPYTQKAWARGDAAPLYCKGPGNEDAFLYMDGQEVFRFAVNAEKQGIEAILNECGMSVEDVDYVVCHQANKRIIDNVRRRLGAPEEKFYVNLQKYGNTSAASIPIALDEMNEAGLLKEGTKVIAVGFGGGLTWSSALFTF